MYACSSFNNTPKHTYHHVKLRPDAPVLRSRSCVMHSGNAIVGWFCRCLCFCVFVLLVVYSSHTLIYLFSTGKIHKLTNTIILLIETCTYYFGVRAPTVFENWTMIYYAYMECCIICRCRRRRGPFICFAYWSSKRIRRCWVLLCVTRDMPYMRE